MVAIAADLFAQKGYRATTVREIADAAGILSGSLYHHFDSKESIGDEILSGFINDVLADYRAAVASAPLAKPPGREWMLRLADALGDLLDGLGQEDEAPPSRQGYTAAAVQAITAAHAAEHDLAGWLAAVLATVAARPPRLLGSGPRAGPAGRDGQLG